MSTITKKQLSEKYNEGFSDALGFVCFLPAALFILYVVFTFVINPLWEWATSGLDMTSNEGVTCTMLVDHGPVSRNGVTMSKVNIYNCEQGDSLFRSLLDQ